MRSSLLYEKGFAVSSYASSPTSPRLPTKGKKRRDSVPVVFPRKGAAATGSQVLAATPDGLSVHQQPSGLIPRQTKSMNYPVSPPFSWDPHIDDLDILYAKVNGLSSITPLASLSASSTIGPNAENSRMDDMEKDRDANQQFETLTTEHANTTHHLPVKLLKMTNELMKARLDVLSDAISNKHHHESPTSSKDHESLVSLISGCITHAERMEQLASAHLVSERHLRTVLLQSPPDSDHDDRTMTTWYHDQIRQCVHLYEQQLFMTETLQDMLLDIQQYGPSVPPPPSESTEINNASTNSRWDFTCSVASLLGLDEMQDHLQAIKYQVGLFIGEGVGTGHFIHPPRSPPSPPPPIKLSSSSPTLCIDQLTLLPKHHWVPDHAMQQCQVSTCSLSFSLFERRHHCRRCGLLVCQQHSQHQLPLYSSKHKLTWSRVCDPCYTNIILPSSFPSSIIKQSLLS